MKRASEELVDKLPPRCARCVHFEPVGPTDGMGRRRGECRALPPQFDPLSGREAAWPRLRSDNSCGAFVEKRRRRSA